MRTILIFFEIAGTLALIEVQWELRAALANLGSRSMLLKNHVLAAWRNRTSLH